MTKKPLEVMTHEELVQRIELLEIERGWLQIKVTQQMLFVKQIGVRRGEVDQLRSDKRKLAAMLSWAVSWMNVAIDERDAWITPREYEMLRMAQKMVGNGKK